LHGNGEKNATRFADDCAIIDLLSADCARMTAAAVMHQDIFVNAFADEWTEPEPESQTHTAIIDHVIMLCDFPADSIMVKYIDQQQCLS
jgi:hypothetical protein